MSRAAILAARELTVGYEGQPAAIRALSIALPPGKITVIAGPNGCGKSTLLRALARLLAPGSGTVLLDGKDLHRLPTAAVARRIGALPQGPVAPEGLLVRQLVALGRFPYQRWWQLASEADGVSVERAMQMTEVSALADRRVDELSGGERQRAWIAMAVAQETEILLLDEPTTYLDMAHQLDVVGLIERLNREVGKTVVAVLHDLNQAAVLADHIVLMRDGVVAAQGSPAEVMNEEAIARVFNVRVRFFEDRDSGKRVCLPLAVLP